MIRKETIIGTCRLLLGDSLAVLPFLNGGFDTVVTDPPYGETSLAWDMVVKGWAKMLPLKRGGSVWVWCSMRYYAGVLQEFEGWKFAQDIVWEKHNGSIFHADRFRRVHEHAVQFYRGEWADVFKAPQFTKDATARTVRRKTRPTHSGEIGNGAYESHDGGPRLQRSVLHVRSCHGYAVHPTQKPVEVMTPLIRYSCPKEGRVLDPFMGSGTTLIAAMASGKNATGIENDEGHYETAVKRVSEAWGTGSLFAESA